MTIKKPGLALLVAFVSIFGMSQTASATPCYDQVQALKAALNDGHCNFGKRKRCEKLNKKLDKLTKKLDKGKFKKAARKLSNFGIVVENMAMRRKNPRMHMTNFNMLLDPYEQVRLCILADGVVAEPEVVTAPDPVDNPNWDLSNE